MVICKFFQNGNCRFGSECVNEHFDVRQTIKSEVEDAIKGNQWPLSCFGPFKDKPNLPNFVADQSFEEVRYMCYEAKRLNFFPIFDQEFKAELMEAQKKITSLLSWNRQLQEAVIAVYESDSGNVDKLGAQKNPFAMGSSIFGNITGNSTAPNPFGNSISSSFSNPTASTASIFGNQNPAAASGGGILGQSVFNTSTNFGGTPPQPQTSMFGAPAPATANIFQQGQSTVNSSGNIFGQQKASGSIFGNTGTSNIFATAPQQTSMDGGNIFGQAAAQIQSPIQGFGSFGVQQQLPQVAQIQPQPQQAVGNIFAQALQQPPPPFPSVQTYPQQPNTNMFAQQPAAALPSAFGTNSQPLGGNIFGQVQTQPQSVISQQPPQPQQVQFQNQLDQPLQQLQQQVPPQSQQQQQTNIFTSAQAIPSLPASQQDIPRTSTCYSKIEALNEEQIKCFKADEFVMGRIPWIQPPKELC